jgi:hypothetical protein
MLWHRRSWLRAITVVATSGIAVVATSGMHTSHPQNEVFVFKSSVAVNRSPSSAVSFLCGTKQRWAQPALRMGRPKNKPLREQYLPISALAAKFFRNPGKFAGAKQQDVTKEPSGWNGKSCTYHPL